MILIVYFALALDCPIPILHALFIQEVINHRTKWFEKAAKAGDRWLLDVAIAQGMTDWNLGLLHAARGGHKDLVDFFITQGATQWNWGVRGAAHGGHLDLVRFFIDRGADDMDGGMRFVVIGDHMDDRTMRNLIDLFIEKGARDWDAVVRWAKGKPKLVEFFKNKLNETEQN